MRMTGRWNSIWEELRFRDGAAMPKVSETLALGDTFALAIVSHNQLGTFLVAQRDAFAAQSVIEIFVGRDRFRSNLPFEDELSIYSLKLGEGIPVSDVTVSIDGDWYEVDVRSEQIVPQCRIYTMQPEGMR